MIMVSVNVGKDKDGNQLPPVVGLLIDTHLMPMQGPPKATIGQGGELVQIPGPTGVQGLGVVAMDTGFIIGPLASMTPMLQPDELPDEEESEDGEVKVVYPEDVPTELQSGAGRQEKGE